MNTQKRPPAKVVNLHSSFCEICGRPISRGPEYADESIAQVHRRCLKRQTHLLAIQSECHDLWLQAYSLLCGALPNPRATIIPLAREYEKRLSPRAYLDFLQKAVELVIQEELPSEEKSQLLDRVELISNKIIRLLADSNS